MNLGLEEHLLRSLRGDVFLLWRHRPAIIIGKYQHAYREINVESVQQKGLPVIRRMTGGGAVFHDLGNINFSFMRDAHADDEVSFERFLEPVIAFLRTLGVDAVFSGRNDITVDGMKISGNAQTRVGNRFLHHGTLLYGVAMGDLSGALKVHPLKIRSKGMKSVRSRVTNISEFLPNPPPVTAFMQSLYDFIAAHGQSYALTGQDMAAAERIAAERYRRWDWNYGENPGYKFSKTAKYAGGFILLQMNIADEVFDSIKISGHVFAFGDVGDLEAALRGVRHRRRDIRTAVRDLPLQKYIGAITAEQLIETMF